MVKTGRNLEFAQTLKAMLDEIIADNQ